MDTIREKFDGVQLVRPVDPEFSWGHPTFVGFPTCCGAGKGLGDALVPDSWYGVCFSPACKVHDFMFDKVEASWAGFHYANSVFLCNLLAIANNYPCNRFKRQLLRVKAYQYYEAVNSFGAIVFWAERG